MLLCLHVIREIVISCGLVSTNISIQSVMVYSI